MTHLWRTFLVLLGVMRYSRARNLYAKSWSEEPVDARCHLVRNRSSNLTDSRHLNEIFFDTL
jgi:hypothetical protein